MVMVITSRGAKFIAGLVEINQAVIAVYVEIMRWVERGVGAGDGME